ncbi:MAG TPA: ZIP family metal transporter [Polyangia bacterium]
MNDALIAALPTGLATGLGALPVILSRQLPRRAYDGVLGLGAGLMLAAATLGLLAEALSMVREGSSSVWIGLALITGGFLSGVLVAVIMDRFIPHGHARGHHAHIQSHAPVRAHGEHGHGHGHLHPHAHGGVHHGHHEPERDLGTTGDRTRSSLYLLLGAISIHRLPEGLAIGAGFAVEHSHLGWMLSAAVALQNVCEGMVMGAPLRQAGLSATRSLLLVSATGLVVPIGAVLGYALSGLAVVALPFLLALAAGTLIYVTSNEIIPESHSHGHEGTASAGLVVGFLLTMLLGAALH